MDPGEIFGAIATFVVGAIVILSLLGVSIGSGIMDIATSILIFAFVVAVIVGLLSEGF
ncbi:hypothetical protein [Halorubellus litoreus]|uniref:Uncharacterized protein n=1 Tax=Halorubellus litoreus TaxID=755308 RepID=A0ABD5VBT4_9EURY